MPEDWGRTSQRDALREDKLCKKCGQPLRELSRGSFTMWVFGTETCKCTVSMKMDHLSKFGQNAESLPVEDKSGLISNRYSLESLIARGGMGKIFLALDKNLDKNCVVKILRPEAVEDESKTERFYREARACARLEHPNLVSLTDSGITNSGLPYIVMDYVNGISLREMFDSRESLSLKEYLDLFEQLSSALSYIHAQGIVHRDVKPDNIVVSEDIGQNNLLKLIDFGIAKIEEEEEQQKLTQTGEIFGSPEYMSPEQCGWKEVDHRTDIYSAGCLMYEALTSNPPFRGSLLDVIDMQVLEKPKRFKDTGTPIVVPSQLEQLVMKCLEKDPDDRYQTAEELLAELKSISADLSKEILKARIITASIVGLVVLIIVAIIFYPELNFSHQPQSIEAHKPEFEHAIMSIDTDKVADLEFHDSRMTFEKNKQYAQLDKLMQARVLIEENEGDNEVPSLFLEGLKEAVSADTPPHVVYFFAYQILEDFGNRNRNNDAEGNNILTADTVRSILKPMEAGLSDKLREDTAVYASLTYRNLTDYVDDENKYLQLLLKSRQFASKTTDTYRWLQREIDSDIGQQYLDMKKPNNAYRYFLLARSKVWKKHTREFCRISMLIARSCNQAGDFQIAKESADEGIEVLSTFEPRRSGRRRSRFNRDRTLMSGLNRELKIAESHLAKKKTN